MRSAPLELLDLGERNGARIFLQSCPWNLFRQPAIREAFEIYHWLEAGAFMARYPNGLDIRTSRAVMDVRNGVEAGRVHRIKTDKDK